jgi:hypothetical protein
MSRHCAFGVPRPLCIVFAFLCFAVIAAPAWAQFETRATQVLPNEVFNVAVGDFNHDGKLDAAVVGDSLWVLLGNGDGTFQAPSSYAGPFYFVAVADFNNDGILDLAVVPEGNAVSVFLGNGDGTFQPPKNSPTTGPSAFIVVGDFNGDHKMDIAVVNNPYISILLGNGDGTFQAPIDNESFPAPGWLAVGDFNHDHRLDVAVVGTLGGSSNLGVLLGNGDGTLQSAIVSPLDYPPYSVVAADFNNDGNLDLAVGNLGGGGSVSVFLGNGTGDFGAPREYPGGGTRVIVGDFNGDGKLDLVAWPGAYGVAELLGNGDGTFQSAVVYPANGDPGAVGDLNGDRKLDLIVFEFLGTTITSMLNTGAVKFSPTTPLAYAVQLISTTSGPKSVELTNTGTSAISIRSVKASGPFEASNNCSGEIAAGASCKIDVTFTPSRGGKQSGVVTLIDSASSKPQFIELSGVGTVIKTSPTSLSFPSQKVGTKSAPQAVTVNNEGSTAVTMGTISISGANSADFSETDNCSGQSIPAGGACKVNVIFSPTKTGTRTAQLEIPPQGAPAPRPVALTGKGS